MKLIEKLFKLEANGTNLKTEAIAGVTTFMTMAYVLVVSPMILSKTGMDHGALITATALSAAIATFMMGFFANLPFALAPGMGINAFFAYGICLGMGYSWQVALTAVFIEGIIFVLLTMCNVREALIEAIPRNIKYAISVGIGLFISLIGLSSAGIVKSGMKHVGEGKLDGVLVTLGSLKAPPALVAIIGLLITALLLHKKVKGALLYGIVGATIIAIPLGVTQLPASFISFPYSLSPIAFKLDFSKLLSLDMMIILFSLLFVDMFDTVGTLVGVTMKAKMLTPEGKVPRAKMAFLADALGTTFGALFGTSTVTSYVESAAGVAEGGRTGLTSIFVGILFLGALVFTPLFLIIPAAATAPALILVGLFMISSIKEIDFSDFTESLPAFLTIILMPLSYSIASGVAVGILSYVLIKIMSGRFRDPSWVTYLLGFVFIIKFII